MGLFQLLSTENDVIILQDHNKRFAWKQIKALIAGTQQELEFRKAKSCAILSDNTLEFVVSFLACSYLGVDILLPPNDSQQMIKRARADAYVGEFDQSIVIRPSTNEIVNNLIDPNIIIFTSGSTGQPKKISRKLTQLLKEVDEIDQILGDIIPSKVFASTVSYQHIYGLLFCILWPLKKGHLIWNKILPFEEPLQVLTNKFKQIILISSPAFLKRITDHNIKISEKMQVYCSGGLLTKEQHTTATTVLKSDIIQVYGSTETGGIAHKSLKGFWQFFPSVEHKTENNILWVKSPFCYTNQWQNTCDIITIDENGFELLGRSDRIVKIEEKRVSLIQVEETIRQHDLVKDVHIIRMHNSRQYLVAVIVLETKGNKELMHYGKKDMKKNIKSFLRDKIERLAIPRHIRFLDELPINTQGKILHHHVESLFK
ncbi:MAG: AMP-binding protein [Alcanivoracaceae bacterium]|nr:AMP-binding protein [Alcanivoracaceae bacterium]